MRVGSKIVCVDNHNVKWLKIGEVLIVHKINDENPDIIYIKRDNKSEISPIMKYRFITLKEYRKLKLEKICQEKS